MGRSGSAEWKIAGYVAEQLIGYGASAQVWRGRVASTGEPVALKVLHRTDDAAYRAARAEAALLSALEHPHLVRLHEMLADGDRAVLVLDLAEGGSLAQVLQRRSRITAGEVVTALSPIAAALAYAHEQGLTHADVSPANILFTAAGQPLLADLGVARLLGDGDDARTTLAYLDPAVAAGAAPGPPSDVFMLAGVALHALAGRPPWTGASSAVLTAAAAEGEIADLDRLLAGVPDDVARVVRRGLSVLPHARGSAAEFALDLRCSAAPAPVELAAGRSRPALPPDQQVECVAAEHVEDTLAPAPEAGEPIGYRGRHSGPLPLVDGSAEPPLPEGSHEPSSAGRGPLVLDVSAPAYRLDRPDFARPLSGRDASTPYGSAGGPGDSSNVAALSLTHQVRARARPTPPPRRRRPGRPVVAGATAVLALALGVGVGLRWLPVGVGGRSDAAASVVSATAVRVTAVSSSAAAAAVSSAPVGPTIRLTTGLTTGPGTGPGTGPTTGQTTGRGTGPATPSPRPGPGLATATPAATTPAADALSMWTAALQRLDGHRERAFATDDPVELSNVYVPGTLLDQDRSALSRAVRPGCVLLHLRTTYRVRQVHIRPGGGVELSAQASLSPAQLRCGGAPAGPATAPMAASMRVALVRTADGYRISSLAGTE